MTNIIDPRLKGILSPQPLSGPILVRTKGVVLLHYRQEFPAMLPLWRRLLLPYLASALVITCLLIMAVIGFDPYSDLNSIESDLNSIVIAEEDYL